MLSQLKARLSDALTPLTGCLGKTNTTEAWTSKDEWRTVEYESSEKDDRRWRRKDVPWPG